MKYCLHLCPISDAWQVLRVLDGKEKRCLVSGRLLNTLAYPVVDEYRRTGPDTYSLIRASTDLCAFLRRQGFRLSYVPEHWMEQGKIEGEMREQSTNSVVMISPTDFQFNVEAAMDNRFMSPTVSFDQSEGRKSLQDLVLTEFYHLHQAMTKMGKIKVNLFSQDPSVNTPDAVFPNNWLSTHDRDPYGLVLYPLKVENRRKERRPFIIDYVKSLRKNSMLDLTEYEKTGKFLEGTGSLVLDRHNRCAYLARSERSDPDLAEVWAKEMQYSNLMTFDAQDENGVPIYHTNVLMSIGSYFAVVCLEAIPDPKQRSLLMDTLSKDRTVVRISPYQMKSMCGNILELLDEDGFPVLFMSTRAYRAFTREQLQILNQHVTQIIHSPIDLIERIGGGGVRCTIAELF